MNKKTTSYLSELLTYMSPCHFNSCVPVNVAEKPEAKAFRIGGVSETVHGQRRLRGVERLTHPLVQLVVGYGAPESWFTVGDGLKICRLKKTVKKSENTATSTTKTSMCYMCVFLTQAVTDW